MTAGALRSQTAPAPSSQAGNVSGSVPDTIRLAVVIIGRVLAIAIQQEKD